MQTESISNLFDKLPHSPKNLLYAAAGYLSSVSSSSYLDAKLIFMHVSGYSEADLVLRSDDELEAELVNTYADLIQKRYEKVPVAYIIGYKGFLNFDYKVSPDVLIPRPETEILVEKLRDRLNSEKAYKSDTLRGMEVGLGSGIISLSMLKSFPNLTMYASDISEAAISLARLNAENLGVSDRLFTFEADIYDKSMGGNFDFLVSNPPYIAESEYATLDTVTLGYEPKQALIASGEGLYFYDKICSISSKLIKSGGLLAFEIGHNQGVAVRALMERAGFSRIELIRDYSDYDRVLIGELI